MEFKACWSSNWVQIWKPELQDQGPVSRKSRELFGPEKPFVKLRPIYCVKLVFSYVVKGIKIKINAKFRASRRLRFEETKRIMSPEIRPKSFGTFEKQGPGARFSKVPRTFRARKAIRKTMTYLFRKAGLLVYCKGNKNKNNCKVSCLETPSFWRYKENYVTRNTPEKFRDFRETGPWPCHWAVSFAQKFHSTWLGVQLSDELASLSEGDSYTRSCFMLW